MAGSGVGIQADGSFMPDSAVCDIAINSPNFGPRASNASVDLLILHYTGMPDAERAREWLCNRKSQVSCHYFVYENGRIVQLVRESDRAWHAGESFWKGEADVNSRSIGIEIANPGHEHGYVAFPDTQIKATTELCAEICRRRGIDFSNILAHSDIAPSRKMDPGELFPWDRLAAAGLGRWAAPAPAAGGRPLREGDCGMPVNELQRMLANYGFDLAANGVFDLSTRLCVEAFQRHFRQQKVDGIADESTISSLRGVLAQSSNPV